jgi:hypothetical protein
MTVLLMHADDLRRRLGERIELGHKLLQEIEQRRPATQAEAEEVGAGGKAWHDYNEQLLDKAFSDDSEAESYSRALPIFSVSTYEDYRRSAEHRLRAGIHHLEGLLGRLELFSSAGEPERQARASTGAEREAYMSALYRLTGGRTTLSKSSREVGAEIGLSDEVRDDVEDWLRSEGLIEFVAFGPQVALTHTGRRRFEPGSRVEAMESPSTSTIINIAGNVSQSSIGQSGGHIEFHVDAAIDDDTVAAIHGYLETLARALQQHGRDLQPDVAGLLEANRSTIESQLVSPAPDREVLRRTIGVIQRVVENVGGNLASAGIIQAGAIAIERLAG